MDIACLYIAVQSAVSWLLMDVLLRPQFCRVTLVGVVIFIPYPFLKRATGSTQLFGAALIAVGVRQGWTAFEFSEIAGPAGRAVDEWSGLFRGLTPDWGMLSLLFVTDFVFEL